MSGRGTTGTAKTNIREMNDKSYYEKVFSNERMSKYYSRYGDNWEKAVRHYKFNIQLSESFYPLLTIYEVALRNSLNRELVEYFETTDWYLDIDSIAKLSKLKNNISIAQRHINKRHETVTSSKVIAELTMGFWVSLLNAEYERILWKPLRRSFPFLEKAKKQRNKVSAPLNKIRDFRNRVFHNEPIAWNLDKLQEMNDLIIKVLGWINNELPEFANELNRVPNIIDKARSKI